MIDEHSREDELEIQIIGLQGKIEKLQKEIEKLGRKLGGEKIEKLENDFHIHQEDELSISHDTLKQDISELKDKFEHQCENCQILMQDRVKEIKEIEARQTVKIWKLDPKILNEADKYILVEKAKLTLWIWGLKNEISTRAIIKEMEKYFEGEKIE